MSLDQVESYTARTPPPLAWLGPQWGLRWVTVAAWVVVLATAGILLAPLWLTYGRQLWSAEHYQFVPVLLAAVAWLAYGRWRSLPLGRTRPGSRVLRVIGWAGALLTVSAAAFANSPLLSFVAVFALTLAGIYEWRGMAGVWHFLPVLGVLCLAVRPPFGWDQRLILAMQRIATDWASGALDLMGIHHLASGVVVRLPEQEFFVAEACSGVHSLFAALAFIAVYSAITHRGFPRVVCLLAVSVFWVLVANILRVVAVVVLSTRYHLPVIEGWGHELLGIAVFAVVIAMVLSMDRLFLFIMPLREKLPSLVRADTSRDSASGGAGNLWGRAVWSVAVAVCFVGVALGLRSMPKARAVTGRLFSPTAGLVEVPGEVLPDRWNGWRKVDFEYRENENELRGAFSRIWNFRNGRMQAAISIDGPFPSWHDTELCYRGLGYAIQGRDDHILPADEGDAGGFTELKIAGGRGRQGYVLFIAYSEAGQPLRPPVSRYASITRLLGIWKSRLTEAAPRNLYEGRVYQVQLLAESGVPFTEVEKADLRDLFHEMRRRIAEFVRKSRE